ncbi:hypothetical protein VSDG_04196 [Cytospora chrysosperma]|uniref:Uncharacterized protein n=1 Tax=Cytospora chrysosperma TaxID=252740 RepID=A0A423W1H7_CYTCH|nr:hypothetical protein VSDG_04196 [Valsa sordida]
MLRGDAHHNGTLDIILLTPENFKLKTPCSGGSNTENKALAPCRTQTFIQEPARDGNINVILPDQTTDAKTSRRDHKQRMEEKIRAIEQRFSQ